MNLEAGRALVSASTVPSGELLHIKITRPKRDHQPHQHRARIANGLVNETEPGKYCGALVGGKKQIRHIACLEAWNDVNVRVVVAIGS